MRLEQVNVTMPEVWQQHARQRPSALALHDAAGELAWGELGRRLRALARSLRALGLAPGERVAYLVPIDRSAVELSLAILSAGAVAVPLSPLLTLAQQREFLADCAARIVVVGAPFAERAAVLRPQGAVGVAIGFALEGWLDYETLLDGDPETLPEPLAEESAPAVLIYSSGTTGTPKGILHTLGSRTRMAWGYALQLGVSSRSRSLVSTTIAANATWLALLPALYVGGALELLPGFTGPRWLERAAARQVTHGFVVPLQVEAILEAGAVAPSLSPERLAGLLCAGSPLRPESKRAWLERFGPSLYELYGCTEGLATLLTPEEMSGHVETVGRAMFGCEIAILGPDGGLAPPGTPGEVLGRSSGMMCGYYGRPEATAAATFTDARGRPWLRSGDLGVLDEAGYLRLLGRVRELILSGGFNVFPGDIEAVLQAHPAVSEAAVFGVPSARWGESAFAVVVPAGEPAPGFAERLRAWANAQLNPAQQLAGLVLRSALPRNALGKVLKRELESEFAGQARPA